MAAEPTAVAPVEGISEMTDRELAENTFRLVCQIAGWQQGANTIIADMQAKMGELMENPMVQNLMSMMG